MKKIKLAALALALAGVLTAGNAMAADTATLTVDAEVLGTCSFAAAGATLDFGQIDPTSGQPATGQTSIDYICTNGTTYSFANPAGGSMTGPDTINFSLAYTDPGTGIGTGTATTLTIDGTIAAADYATKPAGVYTGNVTLAFNP